MTSDRRRDYERGELLEETANPNPFVQFAEWFDAALDSSEIDEAYAMTLATADGDGVPSARIVLLRSFDENGFVFFTNYESHKGADLLSNPRAALVFYWGPLERQIRIEGSVSRLSSVASAEYFASRPHRSKLAAHVSHQSSVISGREELEREMDVLSETYPDGTDVPRPENWGGYLVDANLIEFWQGRRARLHDRLRYERVDDHWSIERLAP